MDDDIRSSATGVEKRRVENIKAMIGNRGFEHLKVLENGDMVANRAESTYIYVRIFKGKLDLSLTKTFLSSTFTIADDHLRIRDTGETVAQLVIVNESFQNSHVEIFATMSDRIQLMRSDFFNIDIVSKTSTHSKADSSLIKNKNDLPVLRIDDPVSRYYNFSKGDLIQIVRRGGEVCYRHVR